MGSRTEDPTVWASHTEDAAVWGCAHTAMEYSTSKEDPGPGSLMTKASNPVTTIGCLA